MPDTWYTDIYPLYPRPKLYIFLVLSIPPPAPAPEKVGGGGDISRFSTSYLAAKTRAQFRNWGPGPTSNNSNNRIHPLTRLVPVQCTLGKTGCTLEVEKEGGRIQGDVCSQGGREEYLEMSAVGGGRITRRGLQSRREGGILGDVCSQGGREEY